MTVQLSTLALAVFLVAFSLIAIGFILYLLRNYCQKRAKRGVKVSSDQRRSGYDVGSVKTTTDDDSTVTLHTLEQILKQEEKSAIAQGKSLNLTPLRLINQESAKDLPKEELKNGHKGHRESSVKSQS